MIVPTTTTTIATVVTTATSLRSRVPAAAATRLWLLPRQQRPRAVRQCFQPTPVSISMSVTATAVVIATDAHADATQRCPRRGGRRRRCCRDVSELSQLPLAGVPRLSH